MFDVQKILKRSWHILWNYRMLWVFGFFLALTTGSSNLGTNSRYSIGDDRRDQTLEFEGSDGWQGLQGDTFAEKVDDAYRQMGAGLQEVREEYPVEFQMAVAAAITLLVVILVLGIAGAVLRYVAESSAIRMVDEYEQSASQVGFRQAWRYGWSRSAWQLFVVDFIVHLPVLGLFVLLVLVAWWIFSAFLGGVQWNIVSSIIAGSGLVFLGIFIVTILMVVLYLLRDFAWRLVLLEGAQAGAALRSAWALVRRQWRHAGLMWLVMVGIKIAWGIVFIILVFPLLAISLFTAVGGLLAAILPALLTAGLSSLFSAPDYWPWVFAGIISLPIFAVVTLSPLLLVGGWGRIYESTVWTLTYRELKVLETVAPEPAPAPAG